LLGANDAQRQKNYRLLFEHELDMVLIEGIRKTTNQGMAIGNDRFVKQINELTGQDMSPKVRGRPKRAMVNVSPQGYFFQGEF